MGKRSPAFSIKIPESNFFFNHMSKVFYFPTCTTCMNMQIMKFDESNKSSKYKVTFVSTQRPLTLKKYIHILKVI